MKRIASLVLAAVLSAVSAGANAGTSGRASPPPLVLSPNLAEPWVLQLQPRRQRGTEMPAQGAVMPRLFRPSQPVQSQIAHAQPARTQTPRHRQIAPQYLPTIVDYDGPHAPGTIVVDTNARYLYLVQRGGTARRYGIGVGRPGFEWAGTHTVTRKAEWPDWRPPSEMRQRQPDLPEFMPGGPQNPLGARALYLGSTLYRIHGSNEPWTIGHAVSSGCIRMRNEDVTDLYQRVGVGTKVHVI
ncbi:L,D-transpeptidase [Polymorphum gilvum]|uniref:ErfK/YbiS/YcfS/YnhG family n=1 Tax=Polymorphum gilvum (strain LMG 25793 / CGMCC 1.9160 / SL003B-26A1) TaxID=991905 RepID=F2J059_POLGS|nr:L,D-transpeptidase [Polymorphum gilvum]ADZ71894.1 ErfK/YbiS/YcfS/YnhG family [Polymorphum gilvum SL003B-26A1]